MSWHIEKEAPLIMLMPKVVFAVLLLAVVFCVNLPANAAKIVDQGAAQGAIWYLAADPLATGNSAASGQRGKLPGAAEELGQFIEKISGAKIELKSVETGEKPAAADSAMVVGKLALDLGLAAPPQTRSGDGYCLETRGNHLLLAGESPQSTRFAVTHFLESLGFRWFMPNAIGEVIPKLDTISLDGFAVREQPDFLFREVWGFGDRARSRTGGMDLPNAHDWRHVPPDKYFQDHPEYFALRSGERKPGGWLCTSNPDVTRLFADAYIALSKQGKTAESISPPDGRGFCECAACTALDVPNYIEPSSGTVCMSDRYARFFNGVGQLVKKDAPEFMLSFYCYSDYTMPPQRLREFSDNLCGWVTTIRFCRIHGINNPHCESRQRYKNVVEGWAKLMKTACYDYNYNLAEVTVPISKITYMKENIPFLKRQGCLGINLESMSAWNLYGPHTYLASRLMWKADGDADAILADYYDKLFGKAAPHIKAYWDQIDQAVVNCRAHCGSFYGLHAIWTSELIGSCQAELDAATAIAESDLVRQRIDMFRSGLESAKQYLALRAASNGCDFAAAKSLFDDWLSMMDRSGEKQYMQWNQYRRGYAERIFGRFLQDGLERTTGNRQLVAQLPDEWLFRYDAAGAGENEKWFAPTVATTDWRTVKTYSATLDEQAVPEELTTMWYRTSVRAADKLPVGSLNLWFGEVDGNPSKVYLNGELVGEFSGSRAGGDVVVSGKLLAGKDNLVVLRTEHRGISELKLGGILRPVLIYSGERPAPKAKK